MKEQLQFEEIKIANPCTENWDSMEGNERKKFCQICNKNVHNIAGISERDFQKLVTNNADGLCVRIEKGEAKKKTGFSFKIWQFVLGLLVFVSGCSKSFSQGTMGEIGQAVNPQSNTENKSQQTNQNVQGGLNIQKPQPNTASTSTNKPEDSPYMEKMGDIAAPPESKKENKSVSPPVSPSIIGRLRSTDPQKNTSTTMGKPFLPSHK